jgi:hypothetical protein
MDALEKPHDKNSCFLLRNNSDSWRHECTHDHSKQLVPGFCCHEPQWNQDDPVFISMQARGQAFHWWSSRRLMIGANTVLRFPKWIQRLVQTPLSHLSSGYISRLFSAVCESARRHPHVLPPCVATLGFTWGLSLKVFLAYFWFLSLVVQTELVHEQRTSGSGSSHHTVVVVVTVLTILAVP